MIFKCLGCWSRMDRILVLLGVVEPTKVSYCSNSSKSGISCEEKGSKLEVHLRQVQLAGTVEEIAFKLKNRVHLASVMSKHSVQIARLWFLATGFSHSIQRRAFISCCFAGQGPLQRHRFLIIDGKWPLSCYNRRLSNGIVYRYNKFSKEWDHYVGNNERFA